MSNQNRIVRIHNDKLHNLINYVSRLTKYPYQHVFNVFSEMIVEGYILGTDTHLVLIEKVLKSKQEQ